MRLLIRVALFSVALGASDEVRVRAEPSFVNLGTLPGGTVSSAYALSADGSTVVGDSNPNGGPIHAFRWREAEGMVDLGLAAGWIDSRATATSTDGETIAGNGRDPVTHAARWTIATGWEDVGSAAGGLTYWATAVSADGDVVVGTETTTDGDRAIRWSRTGGSVNLGVLPGCSASYGKCISADGSIVLGDIFTPDGVRVFRWTADLGMTILEPQQLLQHALLYGVSADGTAAVGRWAQLNSGWSAFVWNAGKGMRPLGSLPTGTDAQGNAISGDGSVVVGYCNTSIGLRAFIWTGSLGMRDLNSYLVQVGVDLTGWTLVQAFGVSSDGSTIAGIGRFQGQDRAWLVKGLSPHSPPPPPCPDVSGDGVVNFVDITQVLSTWSTSSPFGDANNDGTVNFTDITTVLARWGESC